MVKQRKKQKKKTSGRRSSKRVANGNVSRSSQHGNSSAKRSNAATKPVKIPGKMCQLEKETNQKQQTMI